MDTVFLEEKLLLYLDKSKKYNLKNISIILDGTIKNCKVMKSLLKQISLTNSVSTMSKYKVSFLYKKYKYFLLSHLV